MEAREEARGDNVREEEVRGEQEGGESGGGKHEDESEMEASNEAGDAGRCQGMPSPPPPWDAPPRRSHTSVLGDPRRSAP